MGTHTIDLDAEAIFLDGNWYTREDLARRIKAMLDSGDFSVARPSAALEDLTSALANLRTLAFRCPADMADALMAEAQKQQQSVGALLRDLVTHALGRQEGEPPPPAASTQETSPSAPAVAAVTAPAPDDKPMELTKRKDGEPDEQRWFKA